MELTSYSSMLRRLAVLACSLAVTAAALAAAGCLTVFEGRLVIRLGKGGLYHWAFAPEFFLVALLAVVALVVAAPSRRARVAALCANHPALLTAFGALASMLYLLGQWRLPWELYLPLIIAGTLALSLAVRTLPVARLAPLSDRRWPVPALVPATTGALVALAWAIFRGYPYVVDSSCQWVQAKLLATGRLYVPAPELPDFFRTQAMVVADGRWYSQYLPGHVAILALAERLAPGAAWLVNPLAGGGSIWLTAWLGGRLYDRRTGLLAAALLAISPLFLIQQSEMMNHGTAHLLLLAATCRIVAMPGSARPWLNAAGAGLAAGWVLAMRPLTAAGLMLPMAVVGLVRILPLVPRRALVVGAGLGGFAVPVALLLLYNFGTTGSPLHTGYGIANPAMHQMGFDSQFRPTQGLVNSLNNLFAMNVWFLALAVGSWLPLVVFVLLGKWRGPDVMLLAMVASLSGAYALYRYQDSWFGPRFLYESLFAIALLSARGILAVTEALARLVGREGARRLALLAVLPVVQDAGFFLRERGGDFHGWHRVAHLSSLPVLERFAGDPSAVVFVPPTTPDLFILANMRYPEGPLFPNDLGARNGELMEHLPGRRFYRWDGTTITPIAGP